MKDKIHQKNNIQLDIGLNEEKLPVSIQWSTDTDAKSKACKAMFLSLFDEETKDTLKIDLWTTKMQINEMDRFMFQTLRSLADTYFRATQNRELASQMQQFVNYFGEQTGDYSEGVKERCQGFPTLRVRDSLRSQGSRFKVQGSRFKVQGSRFKVQGSR